MALNPALSSLRLGPQSATHVVELYLDFVCPFSKKLFETLHSSFLHPLFLSPATSSPPSHSGSDSELLGRVRNEVQFIFRIQVQPWHPSSTLLHESLIALTQLHHPTTNADADDKGGSQVPVWAGIQKLFHVSESFYDSATTNEPRTESYRRLAHLLSPTTSKEPPEADFEKRLMEKLRISATRDGEKASNSGNQVTTLLKSQVKLSRQNGIHVSPTVFMDGLVDAAVSSSWTSSDWKDWFKKVLT